MDAARFREELEEAKSTELDRLGSNKLLLALTDADLNAESVLRAAADSENAAHTTFAAWADDEDDPDARELFAWVRDREADHLDRVLDSLAALQNGSSDAAGDDSDDADAYDPADGGTMHSYLRGRDDAVERVAAGCVARALVTGRTHLQLVSFFVNESDEARADLFRDLRAETDEELERGLSFLDAHCDADDWERARMVAEYTIQVAYDDYADALDGLGVDVKPVC
ncbi:rubrerythrin family protein [Halobaculum sp. D14]|uniref:rubrerythrin family protein n=1 Tax=unclassified Halobaculum TaxID=2640896 RepID=UPI003EC0F2A1